MSLTLEELLSKLGRGKLCGVALVTQGRIIKEDAVDKVVDAVNEALVRLYTMFTIKEDMLYLEIRQDINKYYLTAEHAITGTSSDTEEQYLKTLDGTKFKDNVLKIVRVYDKEGREFPINVPDKRAIITTQNNVLMLSVCEHTPDELIISYKAGHSKLSKDDLEEDVELPDNLLGALESYVSYLIYSSIGSASALQNAQNSMQEFQMITQNILDSGTVEQALGAKPDKFIDRGFV